MYRGTGALRRQTGPSIGPNPGVFPSAFQFASQSVGGRKKFRARVLAAIQFPLYLILILPDSRDDLVHLLEEFAFAGRAAHRLAEFVVNRGQQRELFVQIDFSVLQRVVQQVIAVQFRLLLVDCQL